MNNKPPKPVRPLLKSRPRQIQKILTLGECNKEIENLKKQLFELHVVNNKLFLDNNHLSSALQQLNRHRNTLIASPMVSEEDYESSQLSNLYGGYIFIY